MYIVPDSIKIGGNHIHFLAYIEDPRTTTGKLATLRQHLINQKEAIFGMKTSSYVENPYTNKLILKKISELFSFYDESLSGPLLEFVSNTYCTYMKNYTGLDKVQDHQNYCNF